MKDCNTFKNASWRKWSSIVSIFVLLATLKVLLSEETKFVDFIQYWSASKIFINGDNPYDVSQIAQFEWKVWESKLEPIRMWNPPVIFPFIAVLGLFSFDIARLLWFVFSTLAVSLSAYCLAMRCIKSKLNGESAVSQAKFPALIVLFCALFYPLMLTLYEGQISPLLLLGLTGYLYLGRNDRKWVRLFGGVALSVTLLKPHLLMLLYVIVVFEALRHRHWHVIAGFAIGATLLAALPWIYNSQIYHQYLEAFNSPPTYFRTPTLGSFLQATAPSGLERLFRVAPSILALAFVSILYWCQALPVSLRDEILIPLSLLTAPYGWVFDHLLILPLLIAVIAIALRSNTKYLIVLVFGANLLYLMGPSKMGHQWFIWYPAFVSVIGMRASWLSSKYSNNN